MKKLMTSLVLTSLAFSSAIYAQTADPKTQLAAKVVTLQQGSELDRLVAQLAGSTSQDLIAIWGPKLQENVAQAKQQKTSEDLNAELQKYAQDARQLIAKQVGKVSAEVLVPAYAERFTLEELQQLAAFFASPVIKKYQTAAPELGNLFIQKLIDASKPDVLARVKQFDDAAQKIIGAASAAPGVAKPAKK